MHSCIYEGWVRHRRFEAPAHAFRYALYLTYLDLDELPSLFGDGWLWGNERWALASFRRADHLGDPARPLAQCVRDLVEREAGFRPEGPIRLLTHLRWLNWVFNPVSIFWCFDRAERPQAIVLEVHNTPWGERHCYVLDAQGTTASRRFEFRRAKAFHVSPFLDMDLSYRLVLTRPERTQVTHMECRRGERKVLDATLNLQRVEMRPSSLLRVLCRYPAMPLRVVAGIYLQAWKLWRKGAAYHPHPGSLEDSRNPA